MGYARGHAHRCRERGQGTVVALGVIGATLVLMVGALDVSRSVAAAHIARSAADLAALAGARTAVLGGSAASACGDARRIAVANGAVLVACRLADDGSVWVRVTVRTADPVRRTATGSARAGPG